MGVTSGAQNTDPISDQNSGGGGGGGGTQQIGLGGLGGEVRPGRSNPDPV